jgi:uncharacterized protein with GYD domain
MPHYLAEVAYTAQAWEALMKNPQNRFDVVKKPIEKLGGKIENFYFAFGDYDAVGIIEMPDNVSAAAIAIAFAGGGACKSVKTTPLMSSDEAIEALKKAASCGYKAVASAKAAGASR